MQLHGVRALLTGAAGGIGSAVAERMARKGAILALVGRQDTTLDPVVERIRAAGGVAHGFAADLSDRSAREQIIDTARARIGGIDMLVNCAGAMSFGPLEDEDPVLIDRVVHMNLVVPMLLARQVLPEMLERGDGRIVNIGSTFGSIGFAWFAAYSASKFGLRGFSEALRRELDGSGVGVTYVAPRAVRTKFNSEAVYRMAQATQMQMDEPEWVAQHIIAAIEQDAKDVYLGFPEKLFARLNGLLPRLIDGGLRRQTRVMAPFARG
ncbi:MAG: SDR family oxidoreductase [Gammaproteobacteria bacterium]|nr:SDR family oxidoreductase [Gammaproteobacteria bacterium]